MNKFLENAKKGNNEIFGYVGGVFIIVVAYLLGQLPLFGLLFYKIQTNPDLGPEQLATFEETKDFSVMHIDKNLGFTILIIMFIFALLGLLVTLRIQDKRFINIVTSRIKIDTNRLLFGFGFWLVLGLIFEIINYALFPEDYVFTYSFPQFWILLLVSFILLPIQSSTEELVVRGWLMQGLSLVVDNKWILIIMTAIVFSALHSFNPEIDNYGFWTMQWYYLGAGIFLALITILDEGLELALGIHFATNFYGSTLVNYQGGVLQTDSILKTTVSSPWFMIGVFYVSAIIFYFVCRKKYQFKPISSLNDRRNQEIA